MADRDSKGRFVKGNKMGKRERKEKKVPSKIFCVLCNKEIKPGSASGMFNCYNAELDISGMACSKCVGNVEKELDKELKNELVLLTAKIKNMLSKLF